MKSTALLSFLLAFAPTSLAAQTPQAPPSPGPAPADDEEGWSLVSGVALQSGSRIITLGELDQMVSRQATANNISPRDPAYAEMAQTAVRQLTQSELEPQAGADLGIDPEQIALIARRNLEDDRRELGTSDFSEQLEERGQTIFSRSEAEQASLYRQIWQIKQIGGQEVLGQRPTRDTFIRPGELRAIYRSNRERLNPGVVQLQLILAPVEVYGDEEGGREFLEEVRQRALEGEDFSDLVDEFSVLGKENQGLQRPMAVPGIAFPELKAFAESARTDDIGPVITVDIQGKPHLLIPRVHQKEEGSIPAFDERDVQQGLRKTFGDERNRRVLQVERNRLARGAYIWHTPRLGFMRDEGK